MARCEGCVCVFHLVDTHSSIDHLGPILIIYAFFFLQFSLVDTNRLNFLDCCDELWARIFEKTIYPTTWSIPDRFFFSSFDFLIESTKLLHFVSIQ